MRRWRTTEHENGLQKSGVISYHSFDGQPSFSLGTDVVDPLTMNLLSSAKLLRPVLCAREAHLFSEQTQRHRDDLRHNHLYCFEQVLTHKIRLVFPGVALVFPLATSIPTQHKRRM